MQLVETEAIRSYIRRVYLIQIILEFKATSSATYFENIFTNSAC